jgi:hypothetical protein
LSSSSSSGTTHSLQKLLPFFLYIVFNVSLSLSLSTNQSHILEQQTSSQQQSQASSSSTTSPALPSPHTTSQSGLTSPKQTELSQQQHSQHSQHSQQQQQQPKDTSLKLDAYPSSSSSVSSSSNPKTSTNVAIQGKHIEMYSFFIETKERKYVKGCRFVVKGSEMR